MSLPRNALKKVGKGTAEIPILIPTVEDYVVRPNR